MIQPRPPPWGKCGMDDAERMRIIAQELMVSVEDLEALVAEARRRVEARIHHPSHEAGLRRWRFGR
jgi:hypothetical protein